MSIGVVTANAKSTVQNTTTTIWRPQSTNTHTCTHTHKSLSFSFQCNQCELATTLTSTRQMTNPSSLNCAVVRSSVQMCIPQKKTAKTLTISTGCVLTRRQNGGQTHTHAHVHTSENRVCVCVCGVAGFVCGRGGGGGGRLCRCRSAQTIRISHMSIIHERIFRVIAGRARRFAGLAA